MKNSQKNKEKLNNFFLKTKIIEEKILNERNY